MKTSKRLLSVVLSLMLLFGLVPLSTAQEYIPLSVDSNVTVTLAVGESKWYSFTPTESMSYSFISLNEVGVDPVAVLYDSSMTEIARNDDSNGLNFAVQAQLTAGETYYLEAFEHNYDDEGSYTLSLGIAVPTDVFFSEYSLTTYSGTEYVMGVTVYPEDTNNSLTWTSSDETIATVDDNGKVSFVGAGEVSIKAETVNGLSDTCYITVIPVYGTLELDREIELVMTGKETRAETQQTFAFTPTQTGYYRFESYDIVTESEEAAIDPRVWVYDVMNSEIAFNDDGGEDVNVCADVEMQAGITYYIMTELYDAAAVGSYKAILKKIDTADSVSIDCGDLVMEQGNSRDIYITFSPTDAWQEDYTVTSSDESVVAAQDKTIIAIGAGEATVTVTTELGLTDSIQVTVIGAPTLELDTEYTLGGTAADYGGFQRYAFSPTEAGRYTITALGTVGEDATVSVSVNDTYNQLRYNDTESSFFTLTYALEAGEQYYYDVALESSADTSAVTFVLTKTDDSAIPEAKMNTNYDIEIVNGGDGAYYVFKPRFTGYYAIFSQAGENVYDTKLEVLDSEWALYYTDDDGGGNSQYRLEEEFVAGETYYLKSMLYNCNDLGSYTMRIEPMFEIVEPGDVTEDGVINTFDALLLYGYTGGAHDSFSESQIARADVDGNGVVNMFDALQLYKTAAGL